MKRVVEVQYLDFEATLEKWINYRIECGEIIDQNSWVMRQLWNTKEGYYQLNTRSIKQKHQIIRKYAGDVCTRCYDIPSKRVSYDIVEAKLVEYYCTNYFQYRNDGRTKKVIDRLN